MTPEVPLQPRNPQPKAKVRNDPPGPLGTWEQMEKSALLKDNPGGLLKTCRVLPPGSESAGLGWGS